MNAKTTIIMLGINGKAKHAGKIFKKHGLPVTFFPVQRYNAFPEEKIVQQLTTLPENGWLVLSSGFAVRLLKTIKLHHLEWWPTARLVVVGNSTQSAVQKYFPDKPIQHLAFSFQEALEFISTTAKEIQRVIHLTSLQSFANLVPNIPENVMLHRIPVYELQVNKKIGSKLPGEFQKPNVYLIVPSPSAINAAVELWGRQILTMPHKIFTLGRTTAEYLYSHFNISRIYYPQIPELEHVARLIVEHIKNEETQEIA